MTSLGHRANSKWKSFKLDMELRPMLVIFIPNKHFNFLFFIFIFFPKFHSLSTIYKSN